MKIVFLTPNLDIYGGNLVMIKYAQALSQSGNTVYIIAPEGQTKIDIPRGIKVKESSGFKNRYLGFFSFQLIYLPWVIKNIPQDADIIIPIYFPYIVHAIAAKKIKRMKKLKVIPFFQDCREMIWTGRYIFWLLARKFIRCNINRIITVSNYLAMLIKKSSGLRPVVIVNAVEYEYFYPRKIAKENYLLFVGRKNISKGFPYFYQALKIVMKEYPNLKVKVVTPQTILGNDSKIQYLKYQGDRNALGEIYAKALIYVNASIGESFTLPPLEAMACGTATVLTDTFGVREYAQRNQNCLIVPIKNSTKMAEAIIKLLKNPRLRKKFEINGLKTASRYHWVDSIKKFKNVIEF